MEQISTHCKVCGEPTATLWTQCKNSYYWSKDCQKADWKEHK